MLAGLLSHPLGVKSFKSVLGPPLPASVIRKVVRFRSDCHGLPTDMGGQHSITRAGRV